MEPMQPTVTEIANNIYRIPIWVPEGEPEGFTVNQFLVRADAPLLFHTGPHACSPSSRKPSQPCCPSSRCDGSPSCHVESDECGSRNMWLATALGSEVAHGALGCDVSLNDPLRPPAQRARRR
jgi:hypothetical protein